MKPKCLALALVGFLATGVGHSSATSQLAASSPFTAGAYAGLLTNAPVATWDGSGSFSVKVTARGAYSGRVVLAGVVYRISGVLDANGAAAARTIRRGPGEWSFRWQLAGDSTRVEGVASNENFAAHLNGYRAVSDGALPSPWPGVANGIFIGPDNPSAQPAGYGFARLAVSMAGSVGVRVRLADGTPLVFSAPRLIEDWVPLYTATVRSKETATFIGWLRLQTNDTSDFSSPGLLWTRAVSAAGAGGLYPAGFTNWLSVEGSRYTPPTQGSSILHLSNAVLRLAAGNLAGPMIAPVASLDPRGVVRIDDGGAGAISARVQISRGELTGTFRHPVLGRTRAFQGVVLPRQNKAAGFFLGASESGWVQLGAADALPALGLQTRYVDAASTNPVAPYTNWATAALTIQDAVDVAVIGDVVLVADGVYATGGRAVHGSMNNRVTVTKAVTVRSVHGPQATRIEGSRASLGINGTGPVRCVYLASGAVLSGFTLTNGVTLTSGDNATQESGGGVWCESPSSLVTNCVIVRNAADEDGGGAYGGTYRACSFLENMAGGDGGGVSHATLVDCVLMGNQAGDDGGGAERSDVRRCTIQANGAGHRGGGVYGGFVTDCLVSGNVANLGGGVSGGSPDGLPVECVVSRSALSNNTARWYGGGVNECTVMNARLTGNRAPHGGGAYASSVSYSQIAMNVATNRGGGVASVRLSHCTVTGNAVLAGQGGGAADATVDNCIVYFNEAPAGSAANHANSRLTFSCTLPLPDTGEGNIEENPQLADGVHLSPGSPCRGAGATGTAGGLDIDGEPWAEPPSMGCDEYTSAGSGGPLAVRIEVGHTLVNVHFQLSLRGVIAGSATSSRWLFGDGTVVSNQPFATHHWAGPGEYSVTLEAFNADHPEGVAVVRSIRVVDAVHFVAADSATPRVPYTNWATAARRIQDAVDAAVVPGARVLVTNGVYATGGRAVDGALVSRVAVTRPVSVQSVQGPEATWIVGSPSQVLSNRNGGGAVRCVYLTNRASLSGFTLTNGATLVEDLYSADGQGGGVRCAGLGESVSNCVFTGNSGAAGGGAWRGTIRHSWFTGNIASQGGGASSAVAVGCVFNENEAWRGGAAWDARLNHCTVIGNKATSSGGGVALCTVANSIVDGNQARFSDDNHALSTLNYTCTTPLPEAGDGNFDAPPELASVSHLSVASPCRGRARADDGSEVAARRDLDGEVRPTSASLGSDEYLPGAVTGPLSVRIRARHQRTAVGLNLELVALIEGRTAGSHWDFGDGTSMSNRPYASHRWASGGEYVVTLRAWNESHPEGVATTTVIRVGEPMTLHVAAGNNNAAAPYLSWATAAARIQDAIDAAAPGDSILVADGNYATGGRVSGHAGASRIIADFPVTLRSVNGPGVTRIDGGLSMRCVTLGAGTLLDGFTLTRGWATSGGGVWAESLDAVITNCVLSGNLASEGGGASFGTLRRCVVAGNRGTTSGGGTWRSVVSESLLTNNSVMVEYGRGGGAAGGRLTFCVLADNRGNFGGGAADAILETCELIRNQAIAEQYDETCDDCSSAGGYGGGAVNSVLNRCVLRQNRAYGQGGGGAGDSVLNDCVVEGNYASEGGGATLSTLNRCRVAGNTASFYGGGADQSTLNNCEVSGNLAKYLGGGTRDSTLVNCTVVNNSINPLYGSQGGGGVVGGTVVNSIVVYNLPAGPHANHYQTLFNYSCTEPLPESGVNNLSAAPQFLNGWRLHPASPCINAGNNAAVPEGTDLDGFPRIDAETVDLGAYEFQFLESELASSAAAPRSPVSAAAPAVSAGLRLVAVARAPQGVILRWTSLAGLRYFVERRVNGLEEAGFERIAAGVAGQAGLTTFVDTNLPLAAAAFYRVGVE